jgi:hypothetical protein
MPNTSGTIDKIEWSAFLTPRYLAYKEHLNENRARMSGQPAHPAVLFAAVVPEIDIWRAANFMLKRHGDQARAESDRRADDLAAAGNAAGAAIWRRIRRAVEQLANTTPCDGLH